MQNLVIIDNNISNIQKIVRNVSGISPNIRLFDFYLENNKTIFKDIDNKEIDIILINFETVTNKLDIIEYICENNIEVYEKSIIILYKDKNKLLNIIKSDYKKYVFKCVKIDNKFERLTKYLLNLIFIKENDYDEIILESRIKRILKSMGFNCSHNGSTYIIEIIKYFHINNIKNFKLNQVFEYLGKRYNKSSNTIKGDIREATSYMYRNCNKKFVLNYFNYIDLVKFPTVSEIISTILEKL